MSAMTGRQEYALAHPLNAVGGGLGPYRMQKPHRSGLLLVTILAVDR